MAMAKLRWCTLPILAAVALGASSASAQEFRGERREIRESDEPRFRGGISIGGGGIFVSGYSLGMGGIDGRLGVQINRLIGVYAQPYLSFGGGKSGDIPLVTGTVGALGMVDFTFFDQLFVGAGGGGGIVGSVVAGQARVRFGGYPLFVRGHHGRRKGLMIGADIAMHVGSGGGVNYTLLQPSINIGYEAY